MAKKPLKSADLPPLEAEPKAIEPIKVSAEVTRQRHATKQRHPKRHVRHTKNEEQS